MDGQLPLAGRFSDGFLVLAHEVLTCGNARAAGLIYGDRCFAICLSGGARCGWGVDFVTKIRMHVHDFWLRRGPVLRKLDQAAIRQSREKSVGIVWIPTRIW
jgi:hypothetical protein